MKLRILVGAALAMSLGVGYLVGRARAGVPSVTPLFYGGLLEDGNGPLAGAYAITTRLFDAVSDGTALCAEGPAGATTVTAGRFRVALDASCVSAVHASAEVFIEVRVDGTALPRQKVAAVPYALEAARVPWSGVTGVDATTLWPGAVVQTLTVGSKSYSTGATKYCGSSTPKICTLGGYAGAKALCEGVCGKPTAHMCTAEEMLRFVQSGGTIPADGWFTTGGSYGVDECDGWTSTLASGGMVWTATNQPYRGEVTQSYPVLCCD